MSAQSQPGHDRPDPGLSTIMSERRRLINLAYRLLGSLAEAEDVVQETYARWYAMSEPQQEAIEAPGAWLTKVASRICLDLLGSARARRERYVGEWIPEPLPERTEWTSGRPDGATVDPAERVTLDARRRIRTSQAPTTPAPRQARSKAASRSRAPASMSPKWHPT